jgi:hypothetical protein
MACTTILPSGRKVRTNDILFVGEVENKKDKHLFKVTKSNQQTLIYEYDTMIECLIDREELIKNM